MKITAVDIDASNREAFLLVAEVVRRGATVPSTHPEARITAQHWLDGRNILSPVAVTAAGLVYRGIGRPPQG